MYNFYSTVTDSFYNEVVDPKYIKNLSLKISFTLCLENCNLNISHYTTYQKKLFRLVKFLKENRGLGYKRISHIMTEKGYRSVRTNSILKNNYIYSIYKKGKIRENKIERSFVSKIENIQYLFKFSD